MTEIINWCNLNNGFLTAVLSVIGLLLSVLAIIVSIKTARLPYKKKIKLSSSIDIAFSKNMLTGETTSEIVGVSVNASNVGSRNINITYLGIMVKDKTLGKNPQKMTKIKDEITGTGILSPTEVKTEAFKKTDLIYHLSKLKHKAKLSICVQDSEGTEYKKKMGTAENLLKSLSAE